MLLFIILYGLAMLVTYIMSRFVDEPILGLSKTNGGQSVGRTTDGSPSLSISPADTETEPSISSFGANRSLSLPCHLKRERRRPDFTEEERGKLGKVPYVNKLHY